jgi:hypothetical protein
MDTGTAERPAVVAPLSFAAFKAGHPAQAMFRKLGLEEYLATATGWRMLRALIVDFNGCDEGHFVKLVRQCDGVCSSGERIVLHAISTVCDFAWLADELAGKKCTWQDMNRASGDWLRAVAACILGLNEV